MTKFFLSSNASDQAMWSALQAIAVDIDGTLTSGGRFSAEVISALSSLRSRGLKVCLVTGRPSGWVQGLVSYLPVDAAIAENGGVIFTGSEAAPLVRSAATGHYIGAQSDEQREPLRNMFAELSAEFPQLKVTGDNIYRLSDFTFHVAGVPASMLAQLKQRVESRGLAFTWSTIHAHIMPRGQEKGTALKWMLGQWGITARPAQTTLTIGDSPNDETMFRAEDFPLSAGVANIVKYRDVMSHYPKIVSTRPEGEGFVEIINTLLKMEIPSR
jgi:hypothetical protein